MGYKSNESLCITCQKCTNGNLCPWVRTLKELPKGAEKNKQGYITKCPEYEIEYICLKKKFFLNMMLNVFETKFKTIYYLNSHIEHRYNIVLNRTKAYFELWNLCKERYQIKDKKQFDKLDKYFCKLEKEYKKRHKSRVVDY